jgi:hypothetical protein
LKRVRRSCLFLLSVRKRTHHRMSLGVSISDTEREKQAVDLFSSTRPSSLCKRDSKVLACNFADIHVNPMLALRNVVCNDRWSETWGRSLPRACARFRRNVFTMPTSVNSRPRSAFSTRGGAFCCHLPVPPGWHKLLNRSPWLRESRPPIIPGSGLWLRVQRGLQKMTLTRKEERHSYFGAAQMYWGEA